MKKIYEAPTAVKVTIMNKNLLVSISSTEAHSDAESLSRGHRSSSSWDDEDEDY